MKHQTLPLNVMIERELDAIWRFALRLTENAENARMLVSKTCTRANEQQREYSSSERLRRALFGLQYRIWCDELRSRPLQMLTEIDPDITFSADSSTGRDLCNVINQLPEAQRLVVLLVCVEEFSYSEAADILNVSISTLMSRLVRARVSIGLYRQENQESVERTQANAGWAK